MTWWHVIVSLVGLQTYVDQRQLQREFAAYRRKTVITTWVLTIVAWFIGSMTPPGFRLWVLQLCDPLIKIVSR